MDSIESIMRFLLDAHGVADRAVERAYGPYDAEVGIRKEAVHAKIESLINDLQELEARERLREAGEQKAIAEVRTREAVQRLEAFESHRSRPPAGSEHRERAAVAAHDIPPAPSETGKGAGEPQERPGRASPATAPERHGYPLFVREGDRLVKIGWSKRARKEYRHEVPRKVIDLLVSTLTQGSSGGRPVRIRAIQPLTDSEGRQVPYYQVYDSVAWLRSLGLLLKHGHKGYTPALNRGWAEALDAGWAALPPRP